MDPGSWYDGQTQQYYPYSHFPQNPSAAITGGVAVAPAPAPAPALSSSHVYEASHSAGAVVQPPGVDAAHAPGTYAPHGGYEGHAVSYVYPAVGAGQGSNYQAYGGGVGGDAQGFVAEDASRQYPLQPVAYGDILGRPPSVPIYQNVKATRPHNGTVRKKKKKIPKIVQSLYCEVCKIACNSQEVLNGHKQGKKHKKNLEKLTEAIGPNPVKAPTKSVEKKETSEPKMDKSGGDKIKKNPAPATEVDLETKKMRVLEGGAAADAVRVCTICNVVCNSQVVFTYHIAGQKHAAMVKKQQGATVG